jgi:hypothetical protein
VRPHRMSAGDSARIITQPDGRREICPARPRGPGSMAFVMDPTDQWIRDEDVERAKPLLERSGAPDARRSSQGVSRARGGRQRHVHSRSRMVRLASRGDGRRAVLHQRPPRARQARRVDGRLNDARGHLSESTAVSGC